MNRFLREALPTQADLQSISRAPRGFQGAERRAPVLTGQGERLKESPSYLSMVQFMSNCVVSCPRTPAVLPFIFILFFLVLFLSLFPFFPPVIIVCNVFVLTSHISFFLSLLISSFLPSLSLSLSCLSTLRCRIINYKCPACFQKSKTT